MGVKTKIKWAHATWNPWLGCSKVSPGCENCYAEQSLPARFARAQGVELWGPGRPRKLTQNWEQPETWNRKAPAAWELKPGERGRVFISCCDPFDEEVPLLWQAKLFGLIEKTPALDWMMLTKRPERWPGIRARLRELYGQWPESYRPANLWMGASVEDQQRLDERLPALLAIPAALHWLSLEPLLGPINLRSWLETCRRRSLAGMSSINWVAIGGETGPEARFCFVEDIESILEQCVEAPAPYGPVPCFVKQLGSRPASRRTLCRIFFDDKKGENMNEWPEGLQVREMPWRFYSARGREGGEANE